MLFWGILKLTQKGTQRSASGWDVQPNRPILEGEMVQNNQKIVFSYAVLGHLGTPKWTQKGTSSPASW
jgi:hypothetical protein